MTEGVVRSLGPGRFLDWRVLNAMGSAGGVLICWDKRSLEILDWEEGQFSISCRFRNVGDGGIGCLRGSMALSPREERECLWEEIGAIRGLWEEPWCLGATSIRSCTILKGVEMGGLPHYEEICPDHR
ncbi:hypothetical protein CK203_069681 [Vitis vinifera]|uniref:Uncharacterized protein n=1 Tax=Vitis vinifera TaxID=29760 RepID=A0A438DZX6_VITVI|nr:hypothetical protein CK203_069681 [Vitis vinifera]